MSKKQNTARKPVAKTPVAEPKKQAGKDGPAKKLVQPATAADRSSPKADPKAAAKPKKLSCINAAAAVLAKARKPMRVSELIEQMRVRGMWTSPKGKTPEASLYAAIIREIASKGTAARFKKVERGLFAASGKA